MESCCAASIYAWRGLGIRVTFCKAPKLVRGYFRVVSHMLTVEAELRVHRMNWARRNTLMFPPRQW